MGACVLIQLMYHLQRLILKWINLQPVDQQQSRVFGDLVLEIREIDVDFHRKIILIDGTQFIYVIKQNCLIWVTKIPRDIVKKPHHALV